VQVISDGENTVISARKALQRESRLIVSSYCKSHGLNVLIGNLVKTGSIHRTCKFLVKILNKLKYSCVLRRKAEKRYQDLGFGKMPKVVLPPATRWSFWLETLNYAGSIGMLLTSMAENGLFHP
jgi:hypothetical protein